MGPSERTCALVAAGNAPWEVDVLAALEAAGVVVLRRCLDLPDLLAAATSGRAGVAVVAGDLPGVDADAVAQLHRHDVRTVALAPDQALAERLTRLGVTTTVPCGRDDGDVAARVVAAVGDAAAGRTPADPAPVDVIAAPDRGAAGRLVAVWGPTGAPGRSTVAAGLAAERATTTASVLVDADSYGGSVAQALGILDEVSGLLAAARLANSGALDAGSFAGCRRRVGERLDVVTGLPRADRWTEVRSGALERILDLATEVGDVVVDCGFCLEDDQVSGGLTRTLGRNQLTLDAVAAADEVVVVGSADPVGLSRLARGLMELRERVGPPRVRVVVNRMRDSLGWRERDVLGMVEGYANPAGVHLLPDDPASVDRALAAGRCLTECGDGPLRKALHRLAGAVFGEPAELARSR